jgi:S1-C subfamily serine protease
VRRVCWLLSIVLISLTSQLVRAADQDAADAKLYARMLRSAVWINLPKRTSAEGRTEFLSGTAELIDLKRRLVVTNYHVVRDNEIGTALFATVIGGRPITDRANYAKMITKGIPIKVLARDKGRDLAVVELAYLPPGAAALKLAEGTKVDDRVHTLANPGSGDLWTFRTGKVTKVERMKIAGKTGDGFETLVEAEIVETNIKGQPGESGGPVFNDQGELVAVIHGGRTEKEGDKEIVHSHSISVSELKALLDDKNLLPKPAPATAAKEPTPAPDKPTPKPETAADQEETAARKLKIAKSLAADGKTDKARERYHDIVKLYPKTKAAEEAKQLLEKPEK